MRTLTGVENWARMPPAALAVEPAPAKGSRSSTTTSVTPGRARCQAIAAPTHPARIMATAARFAGALRAASDRRARAAGRERGWDRGRGAPPRGSRRPPRATSPLVADRAHERAALVARGLVLDAARRRPVHPPHPPAALIGLRHHQLERVRGGREPTADLLGLLDPVEHCDGV